MAVETSLMTEFLKVALGIHAFNKQQKLHYITVHLTGFYIF